MIHINQILQKGDWKVGPPRTINSIKHHLSQHNLKRLKQKGKKGKVQPSNFFNVINEPIKIMPESSWGAGDSPTLAGNPPDPLHDVLIGPPNDLFKRLDKHFACIGAMKLFKEKYHLKMTEGN